MVHSRWRGAQRSLTEPNGIPCGNHMKRENNKIDHMPSRRRMMIGEKVARQIRRQMTEQVTSIPLLPGPGTDSVDSFCNRYAEHSVVGPPYVLGDHACLRISNSIVLDRCRRVRHAGDIDPQNANRSGRRRRALRTAGGSAIPDFHFCDAQSGVHRRICCSSRSWWERGARV